jgi:hypothetical protein
MTIFKAIKADSGDTKLFSSDFSLNERLKISTVKSASAGIKSSFSKFVSGSTTHASFVEFSEFVEFVELSEFAEVVVFAEFAELAGLFELSGTDSLHPARIPDIIANVAITAVIFFMIFSFKFV